MYITPQLMKHTSTLEAAKIMHSHTHAHTLACTLSLTYTHSRTFRETTHTKHTP